MKYDGMRVVRSVRVSVSVTAKSPRLTCIINHHGLLAVHCVQSLGLTAVLINRLITYYY